MKKATSIFGALVAVMILFSASAFATSQVKQTTAPWSMSVNSTQQKMSVTQANGTPSSISITDTKGRVIYTGKVAGGAKNIDISNLQEGNYNVYLQNDDIATEYKLEIL